MNKRIYIFNDAKFIERMKMYIIFIVEMGIIQSLNFSRINCYVELNKLDENVWIKGLVAS